jgi:hypothetical protein
MTPLLVWVKALVWVEAIGSAEVTDERGRSAGKVHDVRMVQDGPTIGSRGEVPG